MVAASYDPCLARLLVHEGGYTNHPADPGGPTNFGITIADYRGYAKPGATADDVRAMKLSDAKAIYRAKYWDALRCDELPAGVDDSLFDYGVNSGIARAGKVLRRVLGLPDKIGAVSDDVLAALARRDAKAVIVAINDERLAFLRSLRTWPVFGTGWGRRVADVKAFSLALAAGAPATLPAAPAPGKGHVPPPNSAKTGARTAGAAAAAASVLWPWVQAHPSLAVMAAAAAAALVAALFAALKNATAALQEAPIAGLAPLPAA